MGCEPEIQLCQQFNLQPWATRVTGTHFEILTDAGDVPNDSNWAVAIEHETQDEGKSSGRSFDVGGLWVISENV